MFVERGKTVRKDDVVLAVSISPYANEVLKIGRSGTGAQSSNDLDN